MADDQVIKKKKVLCCDFDGTLCEIDYPRIGKIKEGAKEALQFFRDNGWYIIISSCRSCSYNWCEYYGDTPVSHAKDRPVHQEMVAWLDANGIPYDEVDDGTQGKVSADVYIDDKAYRFDNNWPELVGKFAEYGKNPLAKYCEDDQCWGECGLKKRPSK